eukprot:4404269-Heterocapsa_arctica.AAC.1
MGESPTSLGSIAVMLPSSPSGQKHRYSQRLRIAASSSQCPGRRARSSTMRQPSKPFALLGLL